MDNKMNIKIEVNKSLLLELKSEIQVHRKSYIKMNARLEMFDDLMTLLNTKAPTKTYGEAPDVLQDLDVILKDSDKK